MRARVHIGQDVAGVLNFTITNSGMAIILGLRSSVVFTNFKRIKCRD